MKKISYVDLQKNYAGNIVALDKEEKHIIAAGKKFSEIIKKLKAKRLNPQNFVFVGPIQKSGTVNVYIFSLRKKTH